MKSAVLSCRSGSIDEAAAFFKSEYAVRSSTIRTLPVTQPKARHALPHPAPGSALMLIHPMAAQLDYQISRMRKPVVAIVDGICFGGGAGLAMNSSVRVVTERAARPPPER